jgi:hypothetical protein
MKRDAKQYMKCLQQNIEEGSKNQQRFFTAATSIPLEKVKILGIVQIQQINSSIQKKKIKAMVSDEKQELKVKSTQKIN